MTGPTGTLCLRPDSIGPTGPIALGPARLTDATFCGTHYRCHFTPVGAPDLTLIAHLPAGTPPAPGSTHDLFATAFEVIR